MKKELIIILFILVFSLSSVVKPDNDNPVSVSNILVKDNIIIEYNSTDDISEYISQNSGYKYEVNMKIFEDNQIIENYSFESVPIGLLIVSSNNIVRNCTFIDCRDEGILMVLGGNNTIDNCTFRECIDGIEMQSSSGNTIINCRFLNNSHAGIDCIVGNNNNNSFSGCDFIGGSFGVYFNDEYAGNNFHECFFSGNNIKIRVRI